MGDPIKSKGQRTVLDGLEAIPVDATGKDRYVLFSTLKNWIVDNLIFPLIDFITGLSNPAYVEGRVFYDDTKKALSGYNEQPDVTVNYGEELIAPIVINKTGSIIANGTPVYLSGTDSGYYTVDLANAMFKEKCRKIFFTTHEIAIDGTGRVTRIGEVGGLNTIAYPVNSLIYLGTTDGTLSLTPPDDGGYLAELAIVKISDATDGVLYVDSNSSDLTVEVTDTNGFPSDQRTATTLSFDNGTRTFTISPTGSEFHFYELGDKFEKTGAESVVITDVEGIHAIYYNVGVLTSVANPSSGDLDSLIRTKCLVAYVGWDATNSEYIYLGDERHGISMSPSTHAYLHFTRGAQFLNGLGLGNLSTDDGSVNAASAQFSVESGFIADEDIITMAPAVGSTVGLPIFYLDGANAYGRKTTQSGFSIKAGTGTGNPLYNEWTGTVWQTTEVGNNDYCLYHVFCTNDIDNPVISVMGQNEYGTVGLARSGASTEISNLLLALPFEENIAIATVILQANTSYANDVNTRLRSDGDGNDYVDWRTTELAQGTPASSHANLTDLEKAGNLVNWGHVDEDLFKLINKTQQTLTSSAAISMNLDNGLNAILTLDHDTTVTFSNLFAGAEGNIDITQGTTGGTIAFSPTPTVINGGAGVVTLSIGVGNVDVISYYYNGANLRLTYGPNYT